MFGIKEFYNYIKKKNGKVKDQVSALKKQLADENLTDEKRSSIESEITAAEKKLFKPIFGCEAYVARRGLTKKENAAEDRSGYHLVLLAKNATGYRNLCKLISTGWIDGYYYRPRIDHEIKAGIA